MRMKRVNEKGENGVNKASNIKILISCHKPADAVRNDILKTMQVGTALRKQEFNTDYHDDQGENISLKNLQYCELTAQYWAWKNLDADYYGFFHYRRYLAFKLGDTACDCWGNITEDFIDEKMAEKYGLDEETIRGVVERYDVILPEIKDIRKMIGMGTNMEEQYLASGYLHKEDMDIMLEVIREKYPHMYPYAERYERGFCTYLNNMFIMSKDVFQSYSTWLFDILAECSSRMDMSDYSVEAIRTPGHLAERLLNIYCLYLKDTTSYRFCELPTVAILDTEPVPEIKPAFRENNIAIALSANDFFVPYVSVVLLSIKEYISNNNNYDILIMSRDISEISQKNLKRVFADNDNVKLRFINVSREGRNFENLFVRGHFAIETYFRLLLPELLSSYEKVLYLDSDLIVHADLADLYNTDVEGVLLAASRDADTAGLYNGYEPNKKAYMDNVLGIKKPYEYFQAGVILFNLEMFRQTYTTKEMLEFAASNQWELLDQDVLNYLAQGKYKAIDMAWNVMTDWRRIRISEIISRAPKYLSDEYRVAHESPKIIHFAGPDKAWHQPYADYAECFWKFARKSDYYEVILQRLCAQTAREVFPAPLRTRLKHKIKSILRPIASKLFPQYSRRREILRKIIDF